MPRKRGNGEGSLKQRTDRRWSITFTLGYDNNGKQLRKTVYGKTQKEAIEKGNSLKRQIEKGVVINKSIRFGEWADRWYQGFKGNVSDSTYEGYAYTLSLAKKLLGSRLLYSIKASDIESAIKRIIAEGYSASQVTKVKAMYNQIFRKAEADELIDKTQCNLRKKQDYRREKTPKTVTVSQSLLCFSKIFRKSEPVMLFGYLWPVD